MDNGAAVLERFLTACGRPAWDVTREDVDRVVAGLSAQGLAASTRRGYVQAFKAFHAFLVARKAGEIEAAFGVRLVNPVDEFNAARHVGSDSPSVSPPPDPERMEEFFDFLKERIAGARKYTAAGRDYALFRTLYLAGLRAEESASLDRADVHFGRGPFGKLHVRFGKGARTSAPRPRWLPMLDGLDLILRWYLEEIRPRLGDGPALFCDEGGGRIHRGTIRNRLACLLDLEQAACGTDRGGEPARVRFSPHSLRHACATRNYERGVDLVAIQQMLDSPLMTALYARLSDKTVREHWERARKVNAEGRPVQISPDGPLGDAAWAKQQRGPRQPPERPCHSRICRGSAPGRVERVPIQCNAQCASRRSAVDRPGERRGDGGQRVGQAGP
jgi:integrase/recombinase XerD